MPRPRTTPRSLALLAALVAAWACTAGPAGGADRADSLRNAIAGKRSNERQLSSAATRLGRLAQTTSREVGLLEGRVATVQRELASAQTALQRTAARRDTAQERALRLRKRLSQSRAQLARLLRQRYTAGTPDIVTVVLESRGFENLLETVDFLRRIQHSDQEILGAVRDGRQAALAQRRVLTKLTAQRLSQAQDVQRRHDALAAIASGLRAREGALTQARAARLQALQGSRRSRQRAERELTHLLAQRNQAIGQTGPGGPWSIPWVIVQCESGGQNLPPNSASASGYYQFLDSTWKGLGGSTQHAYQAPKAEQDRLAAQLWDGGRGAHNWVCASLVGIS
ncbi:MAG TPA: transglycosylase family protein [Solirubrobacteraceae bacterium]|jgi:peptidoglycan hydrolase CwlO-like protein